MYSIANSTYNDTAASLSLESCFSVIKAKCNTAIEPWVPGPQALGYSVYCVPSSCTVVLLA